MRGSILDRRHTLSLLSHAVHSPRQAGQHRVTLGSVSGGGIRLLVAEAHCISVLVVSTGDSWSERNMEHELGCTGFRGVGLVGVAGVEAHRVRGAELKPRRRARQPPHSNGRGSEIHRPRRCRGVHRDGKIRRRYHGNRKPPVHLHVQAGHPCDGYKIAVQEVVVAAGCELGGLTVGHAGDSQGSDSRRHETLRKLQHVHAARSQRPHGRDERHLPVVAGVQVISQIRRLHRGSPGVVPSCRAVPVVPAVVDEHLPPFSIRVGDNGIGELNDDMGSGHHAECPVCWHAAQYMHIRGGANRESDSVRELGKRVSREVRKDAGATCAYCVLGHQSEFICASEYQISPQTNSRNLVVRSRSSLRREEDLVAMNGNQRAGNRNDDELRIPTVHVALRPVVPGAAPVKSHSPEQYITRARHHSLVESQQHCRALRRVPPVSGHRLLR
mmetsp:Transcript_27555/g.71497  ORF Transcript_27555/g.71497 Transcript_27555/m.71497 type:complete len:442 (-) Transcript_27555:3212-4537(-)